MAQCRCTPLYEQPESDVENTWAMHRVTVLNDLRKWESELIEKSDIQKTSYPHWPTTSCKKGVNLYHPSIALFEKRRNLAERFAFKTDVAYSRDALTCLPLQVVKPNPLFRPHGTLQPTYYEPRLIDRYQTSGSQCLSKYALPQKHQHVPRKEDAIYNTRYKTQPCLHYRRNRLCPLGENCHFAHGPEELLHPQAHPKYRTRMCANFVRAGFCPFDSKCYFLHSNTLASQPTNASFTALNEYQTVIYKQICST
ncbi:unnamed protein product [Dicrocoelium dendriticum]|nr:unnamed protein product [Dicrocoelium dendriticum]